jgi:hypothetical protein
MTPMTATAQVAYESRVRLRFGVIAFVAALLIVGSQVIQLGGTHASVNELTLALIVQSQRSSIDLVGSVLDMLGLICLGITLVWLHGVARARAPELNQVIKWMAGIGAGLAAAMVMAYDILLNAKAHDFVASGNQSYPEADHLMSAAVVLVLPLLLYLGLLFLAVGAIWTSLRAMRVGLVTRVTGYAGVVGGALFIFQIGGLEQLIQGFWLAALAVTLAARWPQGDPPAWEAGVAVPWTPMSNPNAAQQRQGRQPRGAKQPTQGQAVRPAPRPSLFGRSRGAAVVEEQPKAVPQRSGTPKRKRKRRS